MRILTATEVGGILSMEDVFAATETAAIAHAEGRTQRPARSVLTLDQGHGEFLVMPGVVGASQFGVKTWFTFHDSLPPLPQTAAVIHVVDSATREEVFMDGSLITELRTGAITGLAARRLAPATSSTLAVIGSGRHARSQALALVFALPGITEIRVFSRSDTARAAFASDLGSELAARYPQRRIEVHAAATAAQACEGADVVVTATTSSSPVIEDAWVANAALVCGMGSHTRAESEIDPLTVARADRIVVDTIAGAVDTAGDIANAIESHGVNRSAVIDLGTLLNEKAVSAEPGKLAVFKSVGFSAADVAVASFVAERAIAQQLGTIIDIHG